MGRAAQIIMHPRQHRLRERQCDHTGAPFLAQLFDIDGRIYMFVEVSVEIEVRWRSSHQISPEIETQFPTMRSEYFLPDLELRGFAIDDQTVEIEDEGFNHL